MTKRIPGLLLLVVAAGLACPLFGQNTRKQSRPNIIFVLTDDQAARAVGEAVNDGRFRSVPTAHTPNMDRLARDGALFTNFFCTTPVCSPARASIATGRYASELGIEDFIPSPDHRLFNNKTRSRSIHRRQPLSLKFCKRRDTGLG